MFGDFQWFLLNALAIGAIGLKVYALVDAVRVPTQAFPAAGKLTKPIWVGILVLSLVVAIIVYPNAIHLLSILGVVAAAVYLVDVRPAVRQFRGGRRDSTTHDGPYGPW